MTTLTIKVPDGMDDDINEYIEETGKFVNKSDFARHTIRRYMEENPITLSDQTLEDIRISEKQFEEGKTVSQNEVRERLGHSEE